ncbi:hypothetical protein WAI453_006964 [Rhynchosporium graminicola]
MMPTIPSIAPIRRAGFTFASVATPPSGRDVEAEPASAEASASSNGAAVPNAEPGSSSKRAIISSTTMSLKSESLHDAHLK